MTTIATEIELEPHSGAALDGVPVLRSSLPFLGAVQVQVQVRVGGAEVSLAHLLEMKQGAVLPLDREVEQPMDVMVGEHVVARGVLVAVGDFFGVRITETATLASTTIGGEGTRP